MEEVEAVEASNLDGKLAEFCCMTSLDPTEARERLELAGWNLEVSTKGWLVAWQRGCTDDECAYTVHI